MSSLGLFLLVNFLLVMGYTFLHNKKGILDVVDAVLLRSIFLLSSFKECCVFLLRGIANVLVHQLGSAISWF